MAGGRVRLGGGGDGGQWGSGGDDDDGDGTWALGSRLVTLFLDAALDAGAGALRARVGGESLGPGRSLGRGPGRGPGLGLDIRAVDVDRAERHAFARAIGCGGHVLG